MGIDDKPTAAWDEADLQEMCDGRRREQPRLEFKGELSLDRDRDKREVEEDVQGLANAGGGHVIYGVAEQELEDGSKVASALTPLADGGLYERLNNVLDSRGTPPVPFDIYAISAAAGGIYIVVEVHGHRRPHMATSGRYFLRRSLLVRQMAEPEVADAYRQRFERERAGRAGPEEGPPAGDVEGRVRHGLDETEQAFYRQETGDPEPPGWLSVWTCPVPLRQNLIDPRNFESNEFRALPFEGLWRREEPFQVASLTKTTAGFVGRLPPRDDTYPRYLTHLWPDGLLEFGELQAPVVRRDDREENRVIATHAVAEYVHDFLVVSSAIFAHVGYEGEVAARARFDHVAGYRLAVDPMRFIPGELTVREEVVEANEWRGTAADLREGAIGVAHDISDRIFIAGGIERGAYFFDEQGNYTGGR